MNPYPGILRKMAEITSWEGLRMYLTAYLDEETKPGAVSAEEAMATIGEEEYTAALRDKQAPMRKGIDYIPRKGPNVTVHGYLRTLLGARHPDVDAAPQDELLDTLLEEWKNLMDRRGDPTGRDRGSPVKKAISVVFSLNPAVSKGLLKRGVSADAFIARNIHQAFHAFGAQFYPGEQIGWIAGAHHDKPHHHHHVLVFPYTSGGRQVNLSTLAAVVCPDGKHVRIDYQGRLKQLYWEASHDLAKHVLGSGFTPTAWNEAAADAILTMAAADVANREAKASAYNDATLERAISQTESLPVADLLKFQATLRGITQSGKTGALAPVAQKHLQVAKSRFTTRIDQAGGEQSAFEAAYARTNQPLFTHDGPGDRAAYSPVALTSRGLVEENAREVVAAMAAKQTAALEALRGSIGRPVDRDQDGGVAGAFAQSRAALTSASLVLGGAGNYVPFVLKREVVPVPVPASEYQRRFFEEFAEYLAKREADTAPFDVRREGNQKLSPFRDSKRERRQTVSMQNPEMEPPSAIKAPPPFRLPELSELQLPEIEQRWPSLS